MPFERGVGREPLQIEYLTGDEIPRVGVGSDREREGEAAHDPSCGGAGGMK